MYIGIIYQFSTSNEIKDSYKLEIKRIHKIYISDSLFFNIEI
jgi:hypothetical protein